MVLWGHTEWRQDNSAGLGEKFFFYPLARKQKYYNLFIFSFPFFPFIFTAALLKNTEKSNLFNNKKSVKLAPLFPFILNMLNVISDDTLCKQRQAKTGKNQADAKQPPEAELSLFEWDIF